ncbi:hypothetical protein, partial [Paramuribaculum intestinale]|uniref:hypothetical protein n=1 Tax=Paramuribaculum intestinale TaxID=2094151 RepID=UPI0025A9989A
MDNEFLPLTDDIIVCHGVSTVIGSPQIGHLWFCLFQILKSVLLPLIDIFILTVRRFSRYSVHSGS